jgi:hypothetical protein
VLKNGELAMQLMRGGLDTIGVEVVLLTLKTVSFHETNTEWGQSIPQAMALIGDPVVLYQRSHTPLG